MRQCTVLARLFKRIIAGAQNVERNVTRLPFDAARKELNDTG
jgi:hypothetical protein